MLVSLSLRLVGRRFGRVMVGCCTSAVRILSYFETITEQGFINQNDGSDFHVSSCVVSF